MKIEVAEIIQEAVNLFTQEIAKENIQVQIGRADSVFIYADKMLTQQVVINLLKNAVESMNNMKAEKRIDIQIKRDGHRYVQVLIHDSGIGISEEELEQIFIPFYSTKKSGSGIGLSISQQIMQKQKGDISVASTPGRGSTFTMTFSC
jgi:signal transduction histidine kinase